MMTDAQWIALTQEKLADRPRRLLDEDRLEKAAVLVPLVPTADGLSVLFEQRAVTLRRQAGEICFPGGHSSREDADEWQTACRETGEELGLLTDRVVRLGDLDILVFATGLILYPYVGLLPPLPEIVANPDEVAAVFTVPIERLLATEPLRHELHFRPDPSPDFPYHLIPGGRDYRWRKSTVPELFYDFDGRIVWGMTARILAHFLSFLQG